jgi:zinc transport system substrate-binding protein
MILACAQADASPPLKIFVSILPQQYFFEQIGAEYIDVSVMVGPGQSPATFDPTPKQMVALADAKLYQRIGVPFERTWMADIANRIPQLKIVDARNGITLRNMGDKHDHKSSHSDMDAAKDPHIWTDPVLVKTIADQILKELTALAPEHSEAIKENHRLFVQRMDVLDKKIRLILNGTKNRSFMTFHPSWGYFADRYKLHQIPVEQEGKSPSARTLASLIPKVRQKKIKTIFVQKQFSQHLAKTLADSFDGHVVAIDPLAYNYPENMLHVAKAIASTATK